MLNNKIKLISFILILLSWGGCKRAIDNQTPDNGEPVVYLSVSTRAAHINGEESINKDGVDYEDHVYSLAMLVFDSPSGKKIAHYYTENVGTGDKTIVFKSKFTPGARDFYFVGNLLPDMKEAFENVKNRSEMDAQMNTLLQLPDYYYDGATNKKGFPMARVYKNQDIPQGGSSYDPIPFKPTVGTVKEDCAKLVRVVAKLEVIMDAEDVDDVEKIELINANRNFSLLKSSQVSSDYLPSHIMKRKTGTNNWLAYMPERLINGVDWSTVGSDRKPINYFRITDKRGNQYDIPIITRDGSIPGGKYLPYAEGKLVDKPEYSVFRNHHYKYEVKNLPNQIEIFYTVQAWQVVNKETYVGYGYNVEVDADGNGVITNTIVNCNPHKVVLKAVNGAYFDNDITKKEITFSDLSQYASLPFKISTDDVTSGMVYLEVYYNGASTSVKEFRKK
ncbi:MAG: fimbrial assembly protein [Bacteroidales bacterium]|uniref:fimbrial assembly protein n=1 Tax=Porphyromonas sp. TaxID=1924944 RepID=UPI002974BFE6|nr:fimbrial assembly protein [Porphyromonas sp.]MDD7437533.1 fimbrial assembly protein [Bacteroidales bacterium]MDY3067113.1 fimbrial assembly protein [Porphyromonas sp.]